MALLHTNQVRLQRFAKLLWHGSSAILLSFAIAHNQLLVLKINILDAKARALEQT